MSALHPLAYLREVGRMGVGCALCMVHMGGLVMAAVLVVYQDGAQFYCEEVRGALWEAPFKVLDWDMKAAQDARLLFLSWANAAGLRVEFEQ